MWWIATIAFFSSMTLERYLILVLDPQERSAHISSTLQFIHHNPVINYHIITTEYSKGTDGLVHAFIQRITT